MGEGIERTKIVAQKRLTIEHDHAKGNLECHIFNLTFCIVDFPIFFMVVFCGLLILRRNLFSKPKPELLYDCSLGHRDLMMAPEVRP
jgi:hypothetical protein